MDTDVLALNPLLDAQFKDELGAYFRRPALSYTSRDELYRLAKLAYAVGFYTHASTVVELRMVVDELHRRRLAEPRHFRQLHELLVGAREFALARQLENEHPAAILSPAPAITGWPIDSGKGVTVLDAATGGNEFRTRPVVVENYDIIVVSHPDCGFSQRAAADISGNAHLASWLGERALWLSPPDGALNAASFREWNLLHPRFKTYVAWRASDWPSLSFNKTPMFFLVRQGDVVWKAEGWPAGGRANELIQAIGTHLQTAPDN